MFIFILLVQTLFVFQELILLGCYLYSCEKVYHYQSMNKVGKIVNIYSYSDNRLLTTMGTSEGRLIAEVKYDKDDRIYKYNIGDLQKSYD